jgi:hypothetical protein
MTAGGNRKPRYGFGDIVMPTACHGPAEPANLTVPGEGLRKSPQWLDRSAASARSRYDEEVPPTRQGCTEIHSEAHFPLLPFRSKTRADFEAAVCVTRLIVLAPPGG